MGDMEVTKKKPNQVGAGARSGGGADEALARDDIEGRVDPPLHRGQPGGG